MDTTQDQPVSQRWIQYTTASQSTMRFISYRLASPIAMGQQLQLASQIRDGKCPSGQSLTMGIIKWLATQSGTQCRPARVPIWHGQLSSRVAGLIWDQVTERCAAPGLYWACVLFEWFGGFGLLDEIGTRYHRKESDTWIRRWNGVLDEKHLIQELDERRGNSRTNHQELSISESVMPQLRM